MNHKQILMFLILAALLAALAVGGTAFAQSSTNYNLEWNVIGGGGQPVTSASFTVRSTAGQGAASPPYSASSNFAVSGGYWFGDGITIRYPLYLPIVLRG